MKILIIGGTGNISWHCTTQAIALGHEVWMLNRAATRATRRPPPAGVKEIRLDIRDRTAALAALGRQEFDVVADFICFDEKQAREDFELFRGRTGQFIFVSSEAIYRRAPAKLPLREDSPQYAPDAVCSYVAGKIRAEREFLGRHGEAGFPLTIVRPGYTYDTIVPVALGHNCFTAPQRAIMGKPFLIGGDGNNRWTFTHASDFARAFVALLGNPETIGRAIHITSDFVHSWNEAMAILADALGVTRPRFLHIPAEAVLKSELGGQKELATAKMADAIFTNAAIKSLVPGWSAEIPLEKGLRQTIDWLHEDAGRRRVDPHLNAVLDKLEAEYGNP